MRLDSDSRAERRAWMFGWIVALAVIAVAGVVVFTVRSGTGHAAATPSTAVKADTTAQAAAARPQAGTSGAGAPGAGAPAGTGRSAAASAAPSASGAFSAAPGSASGVSPATSPLHFRTLPPGAKLPSGAACARWVRKSPKRENKSANRHFNRTKGERVGAHFFSAGDSAKANKLLAPRINGDFTGTTEEILRWAACKWGISQSVVFAQAAVESWWQQDTLGDWGTDASACPPGHKLGADGKAGQCPQSYGILQNRYPYEKGSWPGIGRSTAMNADTAYAIWRSCYDGYEPWLNNVQHSGTYHAGDLWGCVGAWFAGRWHTAPARGYIAKVKQYLSEQIWRTRDFQQG